MTPSESARRQAQAILKKRFAPDLKVDGKIGPKTMEAAGRWIAWTFRGEPTPDRWVAAIIQKEARENGILIDFDGFYGPDTEDARRRLRDHALGRNPPLRPDEKFSSPTKMDTKCWSPTTSAFERAFGAVGANQSYVECPYPLRLDWDLDETVTKFSCHKKVVTEVREAMDQILRIYGLEEIQRLGLDRFGGCLNVRLKRGGSSYSTHSWGVAIDWFPSANTLRETKKTARFARDEYLPFMEVWDNLGWMSLGRCFDFDWMHVQRNP